MKISNPKHVIHSLVDIQMIDPPADTIHIAMPDYLDPEHKIFTLCSLEIDGPSHHAYPIELGKTKANCEDCLAEFKEYEIHYILS